MDREQALNAIKAAMPTMWKETKDAIQTLIPELAESEDEKIRKAIELYLDRLSGKKDCLPLGCYSIEDMLRYISKQRVDVNAVSEWLRKHAKTYIHGEYNEFHRAIEYDGSIDIEKLITDLKKDII